MAVTKVAADLFLFRKRKAEYFRVSGVYLTLKVVCWIQADFAWQGSTPGHER